MIKKEYLYLGWYLLLCVPIIVIYIRFSARAEREWLTLIGQIKPKFNPGSQNREYIRLESAFPVEFQRIEEPERQEFNIYQGFTKNLSRSGMCIETFTVRGKRLEDLTPNKTKLRLIINIPSKIQATIALATVRWVRKIEDMTLDRYLIGVSYDDIAENELTKIIKYALWFRRKPDIFALVIVAAMVLIAALISAVLISRGANMELEKRFEAAEAEKQRFAKQAEGMQRDRDNAARHLEAVTREYTILLERLKEVEEDQERRAAKGPAPAVIKPAPDVIKAPRAAPEPEEEAADEFEEAFTEEAEEEAVEPTVAVRAPAAPVDRGDEIIVEPNITRKMVASEKEVYKTFRDYILREDIQLLDRYCSQHRASIYHAASLFALAELRYKNRHIKEMTIKAYRDAINEYPRSKYASYASHRLEQLERNLTYATYSLKYYQREYNLPPLFDYRELEPYKE